MKLLLSARYSAIRIEIHNEYIHIHHSYMQIVHLYSEHTQWGVVSTVKCSEILSLVQSSERSHIALSANIKQPASARN